MRKTQRKPKKMSPVKKRRFVEEVEDLDETDKDEIPETALGGAKK